MSPLERTNQNQGEEQLLASIESTLGFPDYSETQFYIYKGRERGDFTPADSQGLQQRLSKLWWIQAMGNQDAQLSLQKLFGAEYVSLKENQSLAAVRALGRQFFSAADGRESLSRSSDAPQAKIAALKGADVTGDVQGALGNTIKATAIGGQPGYGSLQWGISGERAARLLQLDKKNKIVIAGIGPGDFARYSLPPESDVYGIDYSAGMVALAQARGLKAVQGNVSDGDVWENVRGEFGQPDTIVADYFLDVAERPVDALKNMAEVLPTGGKLMITILIPINQTGFDSKLFIGEGGKTPQLDPTQDIGNTKNPWKDLLKLKNVCGRFNLQLRSVSVTSYLQYDAGRQEKSLPGEIRPSGVLVFEKI